MANDAELRVDSRSVEELSKAVDALVTGLKEFSKSAKGAQGETKPLTAEQNKLARAIRSHQAAMDKSVALLKLEESGLEKSSQAYLSQKAAILASEVATRQNIESYQDELKAIEESIHARETAQAGIRDLIQAQKEQEREDRKAAQAKESVADAVLKQEIESRRLAATLELEQRGLEKTSDEYAELRAEIDALAQARRKGLDLQSEEFKQLKESNKVKVKAQQELSALRAEQRKYNTRLDELNPRLRQTVERMDEMADTASLIDGPLGGVASRITTLSTLLKTVGPLMAATFVAGGVAAVGMVAGLAQGIGLAKEYELQFVTLESQLNATRNSAGLTAEALLYLGSSLKSTTLVTSEELREAQRIMLSFRNITADTMDRAIEGAANLGVALKKDLGDAAQTLGQVLQNPLEEITALEELSIVLTGEQQNLIREAYRLNDVYAAQEVVLKAVEDRYSGIAKAQKDTLTGDIKGLGEDWDAVWRSVGKRLLPALRSTVQFTEDFLEVVAKLTQTTEEGAIKSLFDEIDPSTASLDDLQKKVRELNTQLVEQKAIASELANTFTLASFNGQGAQQRELAARSESILLIETQIQQLLKLVDARAKSAESNKADVTPEGQREIRKLEDRIKAERSLTNVLVESGDARSEAYRKALAAKEAEILVSEEGGTVTNEEQKRLAALLYTLSELSRQREAYNLVVESNKAQQGQQRAIQAEVEQYALLSRGLSENSDEYLKLSVDVEARNLAIQAGLPLNGKEYESLVRNRTATAELSRELRIVQALYESSAKGDRVADLQKEVELRKLEASGVRATSLEYLKLEEGLAAKRQAEKLGLEVGSEAYNTLIKQAEGVALLRREVTKYQEAETVGLDVNSLGQLVVGNALDSLERNFTQLEGVLWNMLLSGEIDEDTYNAQLAKLRTKLLSDRQALLLPLGFTIDEEGNQLLLESVAAVQLEFRTKQDELRTAYQEGLIEDTTVFNQRMFDLEKEYQQKIADMKITTWEKTAEAQQLIRAGEVAGLVSSGAQMVAALAGNSKKLAKISKAAAIFETSTALVQSVAKASAVGWPQNIPLIADAFSTGTQLVAQARSLNEPQFAYGGVDIQGAGTGRSDSIPARISSGESVITAAATQRHKDTLKRMNAGLPIGGGSGATINSQPTIVIEGDASERTVGLIQQELRAYEVRIQEIAWGTSQEVIQQENEVGGTFNPI